jgi:hypothetical protein
LGSWLGPKMRSTMMNTIIISPGPNPNTLTSFVKPD